MSEPFLCEIRIVSFNFPPKNWAMCNGQLMPINQNQAVFSLLGTTYGGNGQVNFALPDLRGKVAVHAGPEVGNLGTTGGAYEHTLSVNQLPAHTHTLQVHGALATSASPVGAMLGAKGRLGRDVYASPASLTTLSEQALSQSGGSAAHPNTQPSLVLNFIIALAGIYPSPN